MNRLSTKVRVPDLAVMKQRGERIVMLTALFDTFVPKFARQYARLGELIFDAARNYANDVREGAYPQSMAARRDAHARAAVWPRRNDQTGVIERLLGRATRRSRSRMRYGLEWTTPGTVIATSSFPRSRNV